MFKLGYLVCNAHVVPGITVDLINMVLSFPLWTSLISSKALVIISMFIEPSSLAGVGTDKNIKSDSFTVSSKECVDLSGFLS